MIEGFSGVHQFQVWSGMTHWTWDDDEGAPHEQAIPNSCCIPSGKIHLLSPQHWSQKQIGETRNGAGEMTAADTCTLFWAKKTHKRTMQINKEGANAPTFHLTSGRQAFNAHCADTELGNQVDDEDPLVQQDLMVADAKMVADAEDDVDEDEAFYDGFEVESDDSSIWFDAQQNNTPRKFDLDGPATSKE